MPATYFWPVSGSTSATSVGAGSVAGVGTGADGRRPYAFTRQHNPDTGDVLFDDARRSWAVGVPVLERVLACLRIEKGTAKRDPEYGIDWSLVDNARENVASLAEQAIRTGLARFEKRGALADLEVRVELERIEGGAVLRPYLAFSDPRGQRFEIEGERA